MAKKKPAAVEIQPEPAPAVLPQPVTITAVRYNRKSIRIEWTQGEDEYGVNFHENPLPDFLTSLAAMAGPVCALCEFPARDAEKIEPTGITVRAHGENQLALIVAKKKIKKGGRVFNIATPLLPMHPDEENETADCMTTAEAGAIKAVIAEAKRYVLGERAQGVIDFTLAEEKQPAENTPEFPVLVEPEPAAG